MHSACRFPVTVIAVCFLFAAAGCGSRDQVPNAFWAGTYKCVKSTKYDYPLFERGYILKLHADGSLSVQYSHENLMLSRGHRELSWVYPKTEWSNGRWWATKDKLVIVLALENREIRGDRRTITTLFDMPPEDAMLQETMRQINPGSTPSPARDLSTQRVDRVGFVFVDGSQWVYTTE